MPEDSVPRSDRPTPVSGLAVPFSVPPALAALRRRWDRAAQAGAGAHVTALYPFLPCPELGPAVRADLAAIARSTEAFEVRFEHVRRFPGVVWIEPEPADTFVALTAAVVERWPEYPPYGGMFEAVIPHLTVVESERAPLDEVEAAVRQVAPFSGHASRLELWCQDAAGRWQPHWRMPFGVRP
jgi:2'-5' RNA ligase